MNLPMADRQGSTGALARRVSEYEMVRDFFASTTVVLAVDLTFMVLFLALDHRWSAAGSCWCRWRASR